VQSSLQPKVKSPGADLCPMCVSFMDNTIEELIEIIANSGVLGSCGALCGQLSNQVEVRFSILICSLWNFPSPLLLPFYLHSSTHPPFPVYGLQLVVRLRWHHRLCRTDRQGRS